jgi:hypothetical protein
MRSSISAGNHYAMENLLLLLKHNLVSQDKIDACLTAYNNSCADMRSEARCGYIRCVFGVNGNLSTTG